LTRASPAAVIGGLARRGLHAFHRSNRSADRGFERHGIIDGFLGVAPVNVTAHPTAAWTAQQLREVWPWDTAPRFLIRERDAIYRTDARSTLQQVGIEEVLTAPRCPWRNPFLTVP
jgi:hypothetical protein